MANIIYGINAGNGLTELPSKLKALETLGLKVNDLNIIGNTDNRNGASRINLASKINVNQFHHLSMGSGSPSQKFPENILDRIDRFSRASADINRKIEELAGPKITSQSGINTESIQGNVGVNGPIGAPSIRYFSTELLNANDGTFEPLDISTSRVSSWSTTKPTLSFGGDVRIESLSPAHGSGNPSLNLLPNLTKPEGNETPRLHIGKIQIDGRLQEAPISSRAFAAEQATHKLKVKINGEEVYLYAMKNIPIRLSGIFKGPGQADGSAIVNANLAEADGEFDPEGQNRSDFRIIRNSDQTTELEVRSAETTRPDALFFSNNATRARTIEIYQDPAKIGELITSGAQNVNFGLKITNFPNANFSRLKTLSFPGNNLTTIPNLAEITKDSGGTSNLEILNFRNNNFYSSPEGSFPNLNRITLDSLNRFPPSLKSFDITRAFGIGGTIANKLSAVSENFKRRFPNLEILKIGDNSSTLNSPCLPEVSRGVTEYTFRHQDFRSLPGESVVQRITLDEAGVTDILGAPSLPAEIKIRRALNFFKIEITFAGAGYTTNLSEQKFSTHSLTKSGGASPEGIPFGDITVNTDGSGAITSGHFAPHKDHITFSSQHVTERPKPNGDVFIRTPHVADNSFDMPGGTGMNFSPLGYYVDCGLFSSPMSIKKYDFTHMDGTVLNKYHAYMNSFYDSNSAIAQEFGNTSSGATLTGSSVNGASQHDVYKSTDGQRTMNTFITGHSHMPVPFFVGHNDSKNIKNVSLNDTWPATKSEVTSIVSKLTKGFNPGVEAANTYNYMQLFTLYDSPQSALDATYQTAGGVDIKRGTNGQYKFQNCTEITNIRMDKSLGGGTLPNFEGNSSLATLNFLNTNFNRFQRSYDESKACHLPINQFASCVNTIKSIVITKTASRTFNSHDRDQRAYGEASDTNGNRTGRVAGYETLPVERVGSAFGYGSVGGPTGNWVAPYYGTTNAIVDGDFSTDILGGLLTTFHVSLRSDSDDNGTVGSLAPFTLGTSEILINDTTGIPKYGGLTGPIPTFKNAITLSKLDLSYNSLTGKLDEWTGEYQYSTLKQIIFNNNRIRGTLNFDKLANAGGGNLNALTSLEEIFLRRNNLTTIDNFGTGNEKFSALKFIYANDAFDCPSYYNPAGQIILEPDAATSTKASRWLLDRRKDGTASKYEKSIPYLGVTDRLPNLRTLELGKQRPNVQQNGPFTKFENIDEDMFLATPKIKTVDLSGNGFTKESIMDTLRAVKKLVITNSSARNITFDFSYQRGYDSPSDGTGMPGVDGKTDFRILRPQDNINDFNQDSVYVKGLARVADPDDPLEESDLQFNSLDDVDLIEDLKSNYGITLTGIESNPIPSLNGPHSLLGVHWFANQTNRLQTSRYVGPGTRSWTKDQIINLYNWDPNIIRGVFDARGFNTLITKKFEVELITWDNRTIPLDGRTVDGITYPNLTRIQNSGTFPNRIALSFNLNIGSAVAPIWKDKSAPPGQLVPHASVSDNVFNTNNQQSITFRTKIYGVRELASGIPQVKTRTYTFRNQRATRFPTDASDSSHAMGEWKDTEFPEES
jgi:hypothetical protein